MTIRLRPVDRLAVEASSTVTWLGQAGFLLNLRRPGSGEPFTALIDPYLSDSLAKKYRGRTFPHTRLVPPPLTVEALPPVDLVICSHRHTDHMDPDTLAPLARLQSRTSFLVPRSLRAHALSMGLSPNRVRTIDAGEAVEPVRWLRITAALSAHERLQFDDCGGSHYLGYVLDYGDARIYHSGDCVPFEGQVNLLAPLRIDVALLPVNGRDAVRLANGVPGNFHPREAVQLAAAVGAEVLVGHHFGMFDFNTVDEADLVAALTLLPDSIQWLRPRAGQQYAIVGRRRSTALSDVGRVRRL